MVPQRLHTLFAGKRSSKAVDLQSKSFENPARRYVNIEDITAEEIFDVHHFLVNKRQSRCSVQALSNAVTICKLMNSEKQYLIHEYHKNISRMSPICSTPVDILKWMTPV